jgi:pyridinium-3,5-biscarboxylic acid mononucleotide sulfurtransferase
MGPVDAALSRKQSKLEDILTTLEKVVVAYSGGVDSALLAMVAHATLGDDSLAVTAVSPSLARRELRAASELAGRLGLNHLVLSTHELNRDEYARNDSNRCYWCKTELFEVLAPLATRRGATIVTGTNLDDLGDHRPGLQAAGERGVRSPLAEAQFTKADVRSLANAMGLSASNKPASPCLASRFAYGVRVTREGLRRIDRAEEVVRSFGFELFRVRDHGDLARIEVESSEIERAAALREELCSELRELGFRYVTLDLTGFRSGSLNEVLAPPRIAP